MLSDNVGASLSEAEQIPTEAIAKQIVDVAKKKLNHVAGLLKDLVARRVAFTVRVVTHSHLFVEAFVTILDLDSEIKAAEVEVVDKSRLHQEPASSTGLRWHQFRCTLEPHCHLSLLF